MAILKKQVFKQTIKGEEKKTKIIAIANRYKDIFDDLLDSLDIKPLNMPRLVNKRPCNILPNSKNPLTESKLNKNILDGS